MTIDDRRVEMMEASKRILEVCSDVERFHMVDDVRRACDAHLTAYEFDGAFTRENLAWIFEKARLQIVFETSKLRDETL